MTCNESVMLLDPSDSETKALQACTQPMCSSLSWPHLDAVAGGQPEDQHRPRLPDAVAPVHRLQVGVRVPAYKMAGGQTLTPVLHRVLSETTEDRR